MGSEALTATSIQLAINQLRNQRVDNLDMMLVGVVHPFNWRGFMANDYEVDRSWVKELEKQWGL